MGKKSVGLWAAALALFLMMLGAWWRGAARNGNPVVAEPAPAIPADGGEGCALLAQLQPVDLAVRLPGRMASRVGTGYRDATGERVLAPVRRLITPLAPGPLGVFWEDSTRTATMLREGQVLSIHFPEGRSRSEVAVVNGAVTGAEAVLCDGRTYASLHLLADGLGLRLGRHDAHTILVEPQP